MLEMMGILSMVGNSFGCSSSGERLLSAARDGNLQEASALLEYNPRLARYSTFGVRNSPLHYSAARGHHEVVFLLLESGVDIDLRNSRGQTALMKGCQYGHWEVVLTLMLSKANIHKTDYLNGGMALHFAATNGHSRCIRLLLADHIPSIPDFWNINRRKSKQNVSKSYFDESALSKVINKTADGGITALHMAALNGHTETVQLLLDLGASVSDVTVEDGTIIDLIGAGSTALHYAACGGNEQCCQILLFRGASLVAKNANGLTPLMVAVSWHRNWLEGILAKKPEDAIHILPSPYLSLPLMSIVKIARQCRWRDGDHSPAQIDTCAVCLERKCTVAAQGCGHEFCTRCALYICSLGSASAMSSGPPGSLPCPLCRHAVISFFKLPGTSPLRGLPKTNLSLAICTTGTIADSESAAVATPKTQQCKSDIHCTRFLPLGTTSFRSITCQKFPSIKFKPTLCSKDSETSPSLIKCSRTKLQGTTSNFRESRRSGSLALNQYVTATGS